MKPIAKQSNNKTAFTIVELLTVMSIIIILMGLLAPAMNRVRNFARKVSQKNQFHSIDVALELFRSEFDGYPDSGRLDVSGASYCGAMKLAEAMVGQDLLGYHPDSRFLADGSDGLATPTQLYIPATLKARKEHYLPLEQANAYRLNDIYSSFGPYTFPNRFVLCDVYTRVMNINTGKRIGMPILYYTANTSRTAHDLVNPNNNQNIYDYTDNHELGVLGKPWDPPPPAGTGAPHTLVSDPTQFYKSTWNEKVSTVSTLNRPYRVDSYILLSAGFDGEYGTPDDIFNFGE
ncbi:MAG: type II secretion system protein [Planctomycetes bacterium]|nr:type II secretion system protein [Planctomycetota bacterium]